MISGAAKEILRHAREIIKDTKPDLKTLNNMVNVFETFQKSKPASITLRTETEQEIYRNYSMALGVYEFEINDMVRTIYWLQRSNYIISAQTSKKLSQSILDSHKFLTNESWFMLLNILTTGKFLLEYAVNMLIFRTIQTIKPPTDEYLVQALFDLCYLNRYDQSTWKNLINHSSCQHTSDLEKLRIIKYAVQTEGKEILDNVIPTALDLMIKDATSKIDTNISKIKQINLEFMSLNKLQREVDFILKDFMSYEKNVNIDDTYIVDFYNKHQNIGFDLSGATHYMTQDVMEKQDNLDEDCLIPSIKLKQHLLKKNNYKIGRIPFYEWNRYVDQTEKNIYIKKKLRKVKFT